jgi:hypothetical protein
MSSISLSFYILPSLVHIHRDITSVLERASLNKLACHMCHTLYCTRHVNRIWLFFIPSWDTLNIFSILRSVSKKIYPSTFCSYKVSAYLSFIMLGGSLVPTAWRVFRLRRVAANILNKQPRTADKGWSSSLVVGRGANNPSP